jgi:predicted CXXCH cytochrome family protein
VSARRLPLGLVFLLASCGAEPSVPKPLRLATADEARYCGTEVCLSCHGREAAAWARSPHGRQGTPAATPEGGADGSVGSRWMQAYLRRESSGYHRIQPKCYDLRASLWRDVDAVLDEIGGPGTGWPAMERPALRTRSFEVDCAACHSTQPSVSVRWETGVISVGPTPESGLELRIGCETCHGPGAEHARAWKRLTPEGAALPRLGSLSPRAKTAVCARCHGGPGASAEFTPADAEHYVGEIADRQGLFPDGRAGGQVYQYATFSRSPCALRGGLTCVACHDPHGPDSRTTLGTDLLCTSCHREKASREHTHHEPAGAGARCLDCHMARVIGGLTAHQRDHRISVPLPHLAESPDACTACHEGKTKAWAAKAYDAWWGEPTAGTLEAAHAILRARFGDAGAEAGLRQALGHPDPFFRANAALYLRDPAAIVADPVPEVRLVAVRAAERSPTGDAVLETLRGDREPCVRAAAALALARRGKPVDPSALADLQVEARRSLADADARVALAPLLRAAGDLPAALRAASESVLVAPASPWTWREAALTLSALGRMEDANGAWLAVARAGERTLVDSPGDVALARVAAEAYVVAGHPDAAARLLTRLSEVLPAGPARTEVLRLLNLVGGPESRP